jgi:hypothetical protein
MSTGNTSGLTNEEFEGRKREIEQNIDNTLERVVDDYKNHWQGVIGESIQNSYDAWCTNKFDRRILPEYHKLKIQFEFDLTNRKIVITDNAGGMPKETFYRKFAGLDTPGEEKVSGKAGGAYGRGFHVIAGLGERAIAETKHYGFHKGLEVRGRFQATRDDLQSLDFQGTRVAVEDCNVRKLLQLNDADQVVEHIQARFQRLLEIDNVTVEITTDGVTQEVRPVDLSGFDVLFEEDEMEFDHGGETYTLRDVIVYRRGDGNVPFRGMSMNKGNALSGGTFMRVKEYRPRQVRHLNKMFGFCDVSNLCPEYENNAHNDLKSNIVSSTPIKGIFEQLEREEFIGGPTEIDERDEIVEAALEILHDNWGENPFDESDDSDDGIDAGDLEEYESLEEGTDIVGGPTEAAANSTQPPESEFEDEEEAEVEDVDDEASEEEEVEDGDDGAEEVAVPEISCRTQKRFFDPGDEIELRYTIENPVEYQDNNFSVRGELEDPRERIDELENQIKAVELGEVTSGADGWTRELEQEGKYIFRVYLFRKGERKDPVDTSYTYFFVGRDGQEGLGTPKVSFIEDIDFFPSEDYSNRHRLQAGDNGMLMLVNPDHPEWKYAEKQDGRSGTQHRITTLVRWGHEAILNRLLIEKVETDLPGQVEDEDSAESFSDFVSHSFINRLGELSGIAYAGINQ